MDVNIDNLRTNLLVLALAALIVAPLNGQNAGSPPLSGPYLGQRPPGKMPEIFAPGVISVGSNNHSHPAISPDGEDLFWSIYSREYNEGNLFYHMREVDGTWTEPTFTEASKLYDDGSPFFSLDGSRLYFFSDRPLVADDTSWRAQVDFNIWYLPRTADGWGEAVVGPFPPNTDASWEFDMCQIADGSFYYTRNHIETNEYPDFGIAKAAFVDGAYEAPKPLGKKFNNGNRNWTPYVDPAETYLIFSSNRHNPSAGAAGCDLYISYKTGLDEWTDPVRMGANINTPDVIERFPYVSPDGKYLFFIRGYGDINWVDAGIIEEIRP